MLATESDSTQELIEGVEKELGTLKTCSECPMSSPFVFFTWAAANICDYSLLNLQATKKYKKGGLRRPRLRLNFELFLICNEEVLK